MVLVSQIKKRDGSIVRFDINKINKAAYRAFNSIDAEKRDAEINAQRVTDRVYGKLESMFSNGLIPTVEQTQNMVENSLMDLGFNDAAKKFIIYRQHHKELRAMTEAESSIIDDVVRTVKDFTKGENWETRENANSGGKSPTSQSLNTHLAEKHIKRYALNEMYVKRNPEIKKLHEDAAMHIHDLGYSLNAYCCGHSLEKLIKTGFGKVRGRVQSSPAKHLETINMQMVNYIGTMQAEFAGAQAFSSVDTFLAPFVRADNLSQEEVNQYMQMLVYGLNVPSRWGGQAPFSNLTFDLTVPDDFKIKRNEKGKVIEKGKKAIVGGIELDILYEDYQKEMDMINLGFLNAIEPGDRAGRVFTFPIPTYNVTKDFPWDSEVADKIFEITGKYGSPYFQNYMGSGLDPGDIRAMCCRLNIDQKELRNRPGGMWGPGDATGSIGVVTMNMNRIGYEANNEKEFREILGHRMDVASQSLETKRKTIDNLLEKGFVPYTKSYLGHFSNHFSTIGLCGMNEACENLLGEGIETEKGRQFTIDILKFMREKIQGYQIDTGDLYNLEATPAESTAYRFARKDKELYPNIKVAGNGVPMLTNSTQLPVDLDINLHDALKHQESIQTLYNGGTIYHTFLGERINGEQAKTLVKKIANTTTLPYFSITPIFSICEDHGYLSGKHETCNVGECGKAAEIYDRIVGYLRPIESWNVGKREGEAPYKKRLNKNLQFVDV